MRKTDILNERQTTDFADPAVGRDAVLRFCDSPLHIDNDDRYEHRFFGRRLRPHILKFLDFSVPAKTNELLTYTALAANRVAFAMHETEFALLPVSGSFDPAEFSLSYDDRRRNAAAVGVT